MLLEVRVQCRLVEKRMSGGVFGSYDSALTNRIPCWTQCEYETI